MTTTSGTRRACAKWPRSCSATMPIAGSPSTSPKRRRSADPRSDLAAVVALAGGNREQADLVIGRELGLDVDHDVGGRACVGADRTVVGGHERQPGRGGAAAVVDVRGANVGRPFEV